MHRTVSVLLLIAATATAGVLGAETPSSLIAGEQL